MKTEIRVSPLFFAVITILLVTKSDGTVLAALISGILHECGHLFSSLYFASEIKSVTLSFYGMKIIRKSEIFLPPKKEIAVCLSGVAVNIMLFTAFLILNIISPQIIFERFSAVNFLLFVFNILPIFSLDGGRALFYALSLRFSVGKSEKIINIISVILLVPIIVSGLFLAVKNGNFTLLICAFYLILSCI